MEWNELEGGENTFSSANDENILGFIILETKIAMLFLLSPFLFFFSSTLLVNRDGTNLIGKSSGFPNPGIFREQIQLDVDRSNSKLLPFSLSATGFYPAREGRRRRRRGESTAVARIST